jgi:hypothetical protein
MTTLRRHWWVAGLAVAALVVVILAPLASADPDGLERVGTDQGWIERAEGAAYEILPDYSVPGLEDATLSTIVSGLVGVALVFVVMIALGRVLRGRRTG